VTAVARWRPVCPGAHRLRPRRAVSPLVSLGWFVLVRPVGEGAEPLPAGEERRCPWPVRADLQDALTGVMDEPGGDRPDRVAEGVRVGFPQVLLVAVAEETGPGGQVSGDVRRDDPAAIDLPGL